ncbi:S-adenosyl-methyltransferase, putative [Plasmodium ovale]|uniref:S-adenosyl-methyltransferase, putative n=1 Tax=Plasmodium ovale TaxID=36330 RepID=A0A1C3L5S4_PLAOA|nr:S-adenosyl-methyltransferase, putative [Plasmodium ovale]
MNKVLPFILLLFIHFSKCFKINSWKSSGHTPFCSLKRVSYFKELKCQNSYSPFCSLRNNVINSNGCDVFDELYVYHTPVLLNEVVGILNSGNLPKQKNESSSSKDGNDKQLSVNHTLNNGTAIMDDEERIIHRKKGNIMESAEKAHVKRSDNANVFFADNALSSAHGRKEGRAHDGGEMEYYIDATLGGGGHTMEMLRRISNCKIVAIDKDIESIYYNKLKLQRYVNKNKVILIHGDYRNILHLLDRHSLPLFNSYSGILIDLGVSSHQLKSRERGFSYKYNGVLDMNMDAYTKKEYANMCRDNKNRGNCSHSDNDDPRDRCINMQTEKKRIHIVLNTYSFTKLKFIIETLGQEKKAFKIAKKIVQWRKQNGQITTTYELKDIILSTCKKNYKANNKVLSRVFQSFRIYINDELKALKELLLSSHKLLAQGKKLIVISYHSLENKCIEMFVQKRKDFWKQLNEKPITPSERELKVNNSSRSAKMFVFEKK